MAVGRERHRREPRAPLARAALPAVPRPSRSTVRL